MKTVDRLVENNPGVCTQNMFGIQPEDVLVITEEEEEKAPSRISRRGRVRVSCATRVKSGLFSVCEVTSNFRHIITVYKRLQKMSQRYTVIVELSLVYNLRRQTTNHISEVQRHSIQALIHIYSTAVPRMVEFVVGLKLFIRLSLGNRT